MHTRLLRAREKLMAKEQAFQVLQTEAGMAEAAMRKAVRQANKLKLESKSLYVKLAAAQVMMVATPMVCITVMGY